MSEVVYCVKKLRTLWDAGLTHIEIAEALGCPVPYVAQLRARHKLPTRRRAYHSPKWRDPTLEEIEERKREIRDRNIAAMIGK